MTIQKTYNNATIKKILRWTEKNDIEGKPLFELIAEKVNCRKMKTEKLVNTASGSEIDIKYEVWLDPSIPELPANSKIVFNNDDSGIVVDAFMVSGLISPQFQKVFLK